MLTTLLLWLFTGMMDIFGSLTWWPVITELPFGIDAVLVQGMGYFNFLRSVFPPFDALVEGILFVFWFKLTVKLIALIPIVRNILHK